MPVGEGNPLDLATLDARVVAEGIAKLAVRRRLQGVAVPGDPPILFFHLPDKLAKLHKRGIRVLTTYLLAPVDGLFGGSRSILVSLNNLEAITNSNVSNTEPAFHSLASAHFLALFINNGQLIFAEEVSSVEWHETRADASNSTRIIDSLLILTSVHAYDSPRTYPQGGRIKLHPNY
jgi:hypothetical protein